MQSKDSFDRRMVGSSRGDPSGQPERLKVGQTLQQLLPLQQEAEFLPFEIDAPQYENRYEHPLAVSLRQQLSVC